MSPISIDDFPVYFKAVHGVAPFEWQKELARQVVVSGWPEGIDVPTGMGKTAAIDIAVFSLALQADNKTTPRTAPTRTFVVVDRRLIVDQAYVRAQRLAEALRSAEAASIVGQVAAALRALGGGGSALEVVRMRGGTTWGWRWLARPAQPAVIVATVDQFGSRLLFRGYGVGQSLRPIDAALCGADSLLILDEAHLSRPLIETMRSVGDHEARAEQPVLAGRRPRPVLLSATLPADVHVFRLHPELEKSEEAHLRLDAERTVHLVDLTTRKDPVPELVEGLAALARDGLSRDGVERVAVVCNTVQVARQVYDRLTTNEPHPADVALLIGRCRQYERDLVAEHWLPRLAALKVRPPSAPIIAVATQTIEVGADLDVDLLVTEAAPLDALLQRLGRLNRLGIRAAAEGVIVHAPGRHGDDPVYGAATSRTWNWMVAEAGQPSAVRSRRVLDGWAQAPSLALGPRALPGLFTGDLRTSLAAEAALAPVVLGPVLDGWARTSPVPTPDQVVAPYLHGITRPEAEVLICWRAGLPSPARAIGAWEEEMHTTPVRTHETVSVPIWEASRFLARTVPGAVADIEGAMPDDEPDVAAPGAEPVSAVVVAPDGRVSRAQGRSLRPGAVVVVPSEAGGHDEWGWSGTAASPRPVTDVADLSPRHRPRLRLRSDVLRVPSDSPDAQRLRQELDGWASRPEDDIMADQEEVRRLLAEVAGAVEASSPPSLLGLLGDLQAPGALTVTRVGSSGHHWIVVEGRATSPMGRESAPVLPDLLSDEDEGSTSTAPGAVTLERHLWDVAREAERQAELIGLDGPLVAAVELAGRSHDLGKADDRFQAMLHHGDALRALARPEPLAKSGMDPTDRAAFRTAGRRSGWPTGMRHEAISAALVRRLTMETDDQFDDVDMELVQHLVQSHHGRARPLLPPVTDPAPRAVRISLPGTAASPEVRSDDGVVDWDGPARFHRLGRRYGWWGLALLESVVRLADIAVSEAYERERST